MLATLLIPGGPFPITTLNPLDDRIIILSGILTELVVSRHLRVWNILYYNTLLGRLSERTGKISGASFRSDEC